MKKHLFLLALALCFSAGLPAQPPGDPSPTYPQGATYVLSNGSTVTLDNQTYDCSTQYYNAVQVSNGTLYLNNCTYAKTGDGSSGDNSSFYGNNSTIYAGAASSTNYESTTAGANAVVHVTGGTVTSNSQGANAVFATNGATIYVDGLTIVNNSSVSRGLHATYGGTIIATNVDITTNSQTSSTIATDRGGGTVSVTGGILMYVMDDDQWSTNGAIGTLVLSNGTYSGQVKYDSGYTANVTVNSGATWNLTANTSVCAIVNNGTINTNGHTLTYTSLSGNGTINEGTGIEENETETAFNDGNIYTIDGRCLGKSLPDDFQGVYIQNGKKLIKLR